MIYIPKRSSMNGLPRPKQSSDPRWGLEPVELTPVTIPLIMTESIPFSLRTLSSAVPLKPSNVCFVMTFRFWNHTQSLLLKYRLRILRIWFTANAQMLHPMLNKAFNSCKNTLPNQISWWNMIILLSYNINLISNKQYQTLKWIFRLLFDPN